MWKFRVDDAKLLQDTINAIAVIIDEATFTITQDGISLRAMDPSRVAMIDFQWPKAVFSEFKAEAEPQKICLDLGSFKKFLKRADKDEKITVYPREDGKINIDIDGRYFRSFNMPTLEPAEEEVPVPKVVFTTKLKVAMLGLGDALDDATIVSDHVRMVTTSEQMTLEAQGDITGAKIDLKKGTETLLDLETKEEVKATYSLSYLTDMVKAAQAISDLCVIEYSKDMPVKFEFQLPMGGRFVFYLAPRIEVE